MKRILSILLTLVFMMFLCGSDVFAANQKQINANIKTKRVPVGTVITLKILNEVNSSNSTLGDQLNLMVVDNITVDNSLVIPQGSIVRGSIEEVFAPQRMYKGGVVRLYFDHIVSPTGKQVPFNAGICNNPNVTFDGALSSKTTYMTAFTKTAEKTKDIVVTPVQWAWEKGDSVLNGYPKYLFAPLTAIISAPVAGIYFIGDSVADMIKKGEDININQGETIKVQLLKPIDMPVY